LSEILSSPEISNKFCQQNAVQVLVKFFSFSIYITLLATQNDNFPYDTGLMGILVRVGKKSRMNALTAYLVRLPFRAVNEASFNPSVRYYIEKRPRCS
jgi:hypothetical protein